MLVNEHRCDRCLEPIGAHDGLKLVAQYHHPRTIELCETCEGAFTIWLGKHPHSGVPLADILAGRATGRGYPSAEQLDAYRANEAVKPTSRVLATLSRSIDAAISADTLRGGGRDFRTEDDQAAAKTFLRALEVAHA